MPSSKHKDDAVVDDEISVVLTGSESEDDETEEQESETESNVHHKVEQNDGYTRFVRSNGERNVVWGGD